MMAFEMAITMSTMSCFRMVSCAAVMLLAGHTANGAGAGMAENPKWEMTSISEYIK